MNKKGQLVPIMVTILVVVIIGMVVLQIIFSQVSEQTTQTSVVDDQFTAANGTCVQVTPSGQCYNPGSGTLTNATDDDDATGNFTECGDNSGLFGFNLDPSGGDVELDGQTMNASYTQESCGFISSGITRTVINNYSILFAVALLVFVAAFIIVRN